MTHEYISCNGFMCVRQIVRDTVQIKYKFSLPTATSREHRACPDGLGKRLRQFKPTLHAARRRRARLLRRRPTRRVPEMSTSDRGENVTSEMGLRQLVWKRCSNENEQGSLMHHVKKRERERESRGGADQKNLDVIMMTGLFGTGVADGGRG